MKPDPDDPDIQKNMKEATSLLALIEVNDEKLQVILSKLPPAVTENPALLALVEKLAKPASIESSDLDFSRVNTMLETEDAIPLIKQILKELGDNQEIIEYFERDILPILFSG